MTSSKQSQKNAQRDLIKSKIKPGAILHLFCNFIHPPTNKFVVVVYIENQEGYLLIFLINSRVHPLIEKDSALKACQIILKKSRYPFLAYDSYLNCAQVFDELDLDQTVDHLLGLPQDIKGRIMDEDLFEIVQAVANAPTISEQDKNNIIASLGN